MPAGGYLLALYRAWSFMYLLPDAAQTTLAASSALALYPTSLLAGYGLATALARLGGSRAPLLVSLTGAGATLLLAVAWSRRLLVVTTTEGYARGEGTPLWEHRLALELLAIGVLFAAGLAIASRWGARGGSFPTAAA